MLLFLEAYRSGHNGTDSKSVVPHGTVGSNPTASAKFSEFCRANERGKTSDFSQPSEGDGCFLLCVERGHVCDDFTAKKRKISCDVTADRRIAFIGACGAEFIIAN